ncbi:hypothetical protein [Lacticaseibacillus zhaodongensis]|uniref:hypothetical protein n=1 Tax=Lacticaseibacillus zhaodongensis TaxID=2668065 RepID=UPI0012D2B0B6|nr:hypothetical protein [Lacticaseibacillus zhaodongensis]
MSGMDAHKNARAESLRQRAAGFSALHDGHFQKAIELIEGYFAVLKPAAASADRLGIIRLGQAYMGAGRVDDASALANEYCHVLKTVQPGRDFMMDVGTTAPDFMLTHMAIMNAFDEDESDLFTIRLNNFVKKYELKEQQFIAKAVRRIKHIAGLEISEQQEILNVTLRQLPLADSIPAIERAILDPDLMGLVRTSLIVWLKQADVNAELKVNVAEQIWQFNPRWTKYPEEDQTILAVNAEIAHQFKADVLPPDLILILLSTIYPAVGDLITNVPEFVRELTGIGTGVAYAELITRMNAELQSLPR